MESKSFIYHKIGRFKNIKVSTKLWKAQIVLPYSLIYNEKEKKSVWNISKVLN